MENSNQQSSILNLFEKFQQAYDPEKKLQVPDEDTSIFGLWQKLALFIGGDQWAVAEKIAELSKLNVHREQIKPSEELLSKIPYKLALEYLLLPVEKEADTVVLAISNPINEGLNELIQFMFGINFRLEISPPSIMEVAIANAFREKLKSSSQGELQIDEGQSDASVEKLVPKLARELLKRALKEKASDIHVQPFMGSYAVRFRIDGILRRQVILPQSVGNALVRFFKSLGGMDPTNILIPQDGRVALQVEDNTFDLRLSVLPVQGKQEKLVIRFLSHSGIIKLIDLGFSLDEIHTLRRMSSYPSGVILFCGPTGSGKTTTLYSILSELNQESLSIATVEEPVEYQMPGLSQTEVNEKQGMTFARALRSLLRQDPDVILIGEIRDEETAEVAMQTALTGHLVFSTLHTNDALSALPRLIDLHVPVPILTEALAGIVSQRLLRKFCEHCKAPVTEPLTALESAFKQTTKTMPAHRAVGCDACNYAGYRGRVVISEIIEIDGAISKLLRSGETDITKLHEVLPKKYLNLSMSASRLIVSGETSIEEAIRVIGRHFWHELSEDYNAELAGQNFVDRTTIENSTVKPVILYAGESGSFSEELKLFLGQVWMDILVVDSPESAKASLKENENIEFVILQVPDKNIEEVADYVKNYRVAMAWSKLPALLYVPQGREDLKQRLREDGATSKFIEQDLPVANIIEEINHALSNNLDFTWGLSSDMPKQE